MSTSAEDQGKGCVWGTKSGHRSSLKELGSSSCLLCSCGEASVTFPYVYLSPVSECVKFTHISEAATWPIPLFPFFSLNCLVLGKYMDSPT